MLELLATADPFAAIMGGLWLFAAGLFPVGFMLGSTCSLCCPGQQQNPCNLCTQGQLPETLTVTFSGLPDTAPGPDLISLSFSSCYGSGASATVTAPGGDPATDKGAISAVEVTKAGSGYAKLGRVEPTLTIAGGSGAGATFTPTLTKSQDACELDQWALSSVAVTGGTGYVEGESLSITIASGDTEEQSATVIVHTKKEEPTLSLDGNATVSITYTDNLDGTWSIASVSVTNGGSGYGEGDQVAVVLGTDDTEVSPAILTARTGRLEPTVSLYFPSSSGAGATITPTLTQTTDGNGRDVWAVTAVSIAAAGSGYSIGDAIYANVTDGESGGEDFLAEVASVDGSGGVLSVTVSQQGMYFKSDGILESVEIVTGGFYYKDTGEPDTVEVTAGGVYYREDASEPPYVATVTVTVTDTAPSSGSGASLSVTIDSDTGSPTFGEITAVNIDDGGDDYLAWESLHSKCCGDYYNGMSVVVKRNNGGIGIFQPDEPCIYTHRMCGVGNRQRYLGYVRVTYNGPDTPASVDLQGEWRLGRDGSLSSDEPLFSDICDTAFSTESLLTDCSTWLVNDQPIEFVAEGGATATVTAGGEYDPAFRDAGGDSCHICCRGDGSPPSEYEVAVTDNQTYGAPYPAGLNFGGNYVIGPHGLVSSSYQFSLPEVQQGNNRVVPIVSIALGMEPCAGQSRYEWSDTEFDCPQCWQKCRASGSVAFYGVVYVNNVLIATNELFGSVGLSFGGSSEPPCDGCIQTPVCSFDGVTGAGEGSAYHPGTIAAQVTAV